MEEKAVLSANSWNLHLLLLPFSLPSTYTRYILSFLSFDARIFGLRIFLSFSCS